jgi:hypothetical protein
MQALNPDGLSGPTRKQNLRGSMRTQMFKVLGPLTHACRASCDFEPDKTYPATKGDFMFRIVGCVCVFLLLASCVLPMAAQQPAAASARVVMPTVVTYYGCVNNTTGSIRIASKTTMCKSTEQQN